MRGSAKIDHKPYFPPILRKEMNKPYICRLAPNKNGFELEWFDNSYAGEHTLYYGLRSLDAKTAIKVSEPVIRIDGLETEQDYEFYIESENGIKSNLRYVRTGAIPEGATVINYLHPDDTQYDLSGRFLCSPAIARVQSGRLIATMDLYGNSMPQNLTLAFYSDDDGKSWRYLTDLYPFYWGSLLYHNGVLYIIGLTTEYGNLQIACTKDEGETWSEPVTLFYGSNVLCKYGGMHRAPMHFTKYNGRLYTTCEYGCWKMGSHLPAILSIDECSDLMVAENWVRTDFLDFEGEWKNASKTQGDTMEGNIVLYPDGKLYNVLRWKIGSMLRLEVNTEDTEASPRFVSIDEAPVANSMFRIIPHDGKYLLITNRKTEISAKYDNWTYRNVLSVYKSEDMKSFTLLKDIINRENDHPAKTGFQYPSFIKEGNSISLVIRSAFNNSNNCHDSNYMLFYRLDV